MEPVRSHRSKVVVEAAKLHRSRHRRETARTLLEGTSVIRDAIASGCRVRAVYGRPDDEEGMSLARELGFDFRPVDSRALERLAGTETPRGPVAVIDIPASRLDPHQDVLVSWGVSDPGNVGTLIRTAAAFGWGFAYVEGSADPWSPKTLRAGAGGQFQTAVAPIESLVDLSAWTTLAAIVEGGDDPAGVDAGQVALLIGEEAAGLPDEVVAGSVGTISIGMSGPTESLNAAVAAGIMVYELSKRRREPDVGV